MPSVALPRTEPRPDLAYRARLSQIGSDVRCTVSAARLDVRLDSNTPMRYNRRMEYATIFSKIVIYADFAADRPLPSVWHRAFPFYRLSILAHTSACILPHA